MPRVARGSARIVFARYKVAFCRQNVLVRYRAGPYGRTNSVVDWRADPSSVHVRANLDLLAAVLQSRLKGLRNERNPCMVLSLYPPVLATLETPFRAKGGTRAIARAVTAGDVSLEEAPPRAVDFLRAYVGPCRTSSLAFLVKMGFYTNLPGTSCRTF